MVPASLRSSGSRGWRGGDRAAGVKRLGREAEQSLPSSVAVRDGGVIPPFPHVSS
jgi:hypothetical protein